MSKPYKKELLHIATLGKSVGLRGDMKLHIKTDFPEQFKKNATFYIAEDKEITIDSVDFRRGTVKLQGCSTPEDAKRYTNAKLYTTIERTRKECKLQKGQHFWFDIEGCDVYEEGRYLGKVKEIERILDSDYLKIKTADTLVAQKLPNSFLLPYLDRFIISVDIEAKKIKVRGAYDILEAS